MISSTGRRSKDSRLDGIGIKSLENLQLQSVVIINDSQARASTVECLVSHEAHATHRHDLFDHDKRRYRGIVSAKCCAGQAIPTRIHIVAIPIPDVARSDHRLPLKRQQSRGQPRCRPQVHSGLRPLRRHREPIPEGRCTCLSLTVPTTHTITQFREIAPIGGIGLYGRCSVNQQSAQNKTILISPN